MPVLPARVPSKYFTDNPGSWVLSAPTSPPPAARQAAGTGRHGAERFRVKSSEADGALSTGRKGGTSHGGPATGPHGQRRPPWASLPQRSSLICATRHRGAPGGRARPPRGCTPASWSASASRWKKEPVNSHRGTHGFFDGIYLGAPSRPEQRGLEQHPTAKRAGSQSRAAREEGGCSLRGSDVSRAHQLPRNRQLGTPRNSPRAEGPREGRCFP